jgi:hypothetical protein
MFFGEGGRIWVQRERLDPLTAYSPVEGGSYDIFGKDGDYTGTVIAPGQVVLFGEGGGRVFGFERGEFDDLRLVAFVLDQGTQ